MKNYIQVLNHNNNKLITMQFKNYETSKKDVEKMLRRTDKHARMISANAVIEGRELLEAVACSCCNMIPIRLDLS